MPSSPLKCRYARSDPILEVARGCDRRSVGAPVRFGSVAGKTTGVITEPVTTTTARDGGEPVQCVDVRVSTGTFDVAGVPRDCVREALCALSARLVLDSLP
jgi:hypothetical protein